MSPPEVWGPPIWTFLHTLIENVRNDYFLNLKHNLFIIIQRICNFLPCPECSQHATNFLKKIDINKIKTKAEFRNLMYLFHNVVNKKKNKPMFNVNSLIKYSFTNIVNAFINFTKVYNTKGNMNFLMESFQRTLVVKDVRNWLYSNIKFFKI